MAKKQSAVSNQQSAEPKKSVVRSSETGKFVPKADAKAKPATTFTQAVSAAKELVEIAAPPAPQVVEPEIDHSLHMPPEEASEIELTPEDLVEQARAAAAVREAPALGKEAAALTKEQTKLNEAAAEHGFEPERSAAHAVAVAVNREQTS